jgi:hypothetical protein
LKRFLSLLFLPALLMAQTSAPPTWTQVLPSQPGRVYAVGVAPLAGNQAQAVKQAAQNARVELVTQLRASVQSESIVKSSAAMQQNLGHAATAQSRLQVTQDSRITGQAADLPGLTVAETWVDVPNRAVYALAYLDLFKAVMDLQARLGDVKQDNEGPADLADPPAQRARAIQRLKRGRAELARLEVLLEPLASAPSAPMLRTDLHETRQAFEHKLTALRGSMTLGLKGGGQDLPEDLAAVVRHAALHQGLGWNEGAGDFAVQVRLVGPQAKPGQPWWQISPSPDFIEARASLQVTLTDRAGRLYEAVPMEPYGVGTSEAAAGQGILADCQKKIEGLFDHWLSDLAQ